MNKDRKEKLSKRVSEPIHTPPPPQDQDPSIIPDQGKDPNRKKRKGSTEHERDNRSNKDKPGKSLP
jgi:hypothetical protein